MFIYNLSGKDYDDIVIKTIKSSVTDTSVDVTQFYRREMNLMKKEVIRWEYSKFKNGCIITKCVTDTSEVIIIPSELNGLIVLAIDSYAFRDTKADKIVAPHKARLTLQDYAFAELSCTNEIQLLAGADMPGVDVFKNSPCVIKFRR